MNLVKSTDSLSCSKRMEGFMDKVLIDPKIKLCNYCHMDYVIRKRFNTGFPSYKDIGLQMNSFQVNQYITWFPRQSWYA